LVSVGVKEATGNAGTTTTGGAITDKGQFIHYTFQRFHCLPQQKIEDILEERFGGAETQLQLETAQQELQSVNAEEMSLAPVAELV
jgi:hypothetical protein